MTADRDLDRTIQAWLDLVPDEAPDRVIDAVLGAVATTPQVRRGIIGRWQAPWAIRLPAPVVALLLLGLLLAAAIGLVGGGGRVLPAVAPVPTATSGPAATAAPSPTIAIEPGVPWLVYASPSGSRTGGGLILAREDGTDRHEILARPDARLDHPDWSRDGSMLAFDVWTPDAANAQLDRIDIWVSGPDGSDARPVTQCTSPCLQRSWAAWSPDGSRLALIRYDLAPDGSWGPSALEILDLASGAIQVVSETEDGRTAYYTPRWSPDGGRIVLGVETYTDATQGSLVTATLGVISADGTGAAPAVITPPGLEARYPDWHPVDDRIVLQARRPASGASTTDLYVVRADGSGLANLTSFGGRGRGAEMPTWAPDGQRIWYSQQSGSPARAAASMAADGSDQVTLSLDGAAAPRLRPTP